MPTEQLTDNLGNSHVVDKALSLGRGGAGLVCRFIRSTLSATHCAKLYDASLRNQQLQDKVKYMTLNPPKTLLGPTYSLAWPTHSLFAQNGSFIGFAMPQAPMGAVQLYEVSTMKLSPKLPQKWHKFDRKAIGALELRAKICANLAIAIHSVHETGQYCLGDLKPQNILLSSDGRTCVVDLDSLQISQNGQIVFPSHLVTPEYSPPEARTHKPREAIPVQWDLFSLAVCLYEVLIGVHPYAATARAQAVAADTLQGKIAQHLFVHGPNALLLSSVPPPHALFMQLPHPVQQLFHEAFAIPVRSVVRPTAERWYEVLSKCIQQGDFSPARPRSAHGNLRPGNQGGRTARTTNTRAPNQRTTPAPRPTLGRRAGSLVVGLVIVAFAFYLGYRTNQERLDKGDKNYSGTQALEQEHPTNGTVAMDTGEAGALNEVDQNAYPADEPEKAAPLVRTNEPSVSTNEVYASGPRTEPDPVSSQRYLYKDFNGDGIGGSESIVVSSGDKPPPNYVETSGDDWDSKKLRINILHRPPYLIPRSCDGGGAQVVRVQVTSPGGRPVGNCVVTLGLATPLSWITHPRPRRGSSGAYETVTGDDGSVALHVSPPSTQPDKASVTLSFAVNGASPQMSTTETITLPVCSRCSNCGTQ